MPSVHPGAQGTQETQGTAPAWPDLPAPAQESLDALLAGNTRFRRGESRQPMASLSLREELIAGQRPGAALFGCVDSRVPAEAVLDQGLGDLFTIRTAGHVVDAAVLGSLEFGVFELQIPLIVVLGHERCGAVNASIETIEAGESAPSAIGALVEAIRPSVDETRDITDHAARLDATIARHTAVTVAELTMRSPLLRDAIEAGKLSIVGARYSLTTAEILPIPPA
jgi:carbonic anhydrase